jgi:hypothetical protein
MIKAVLMAVAMMVVSEAGQSNQTYTIDAVVYEVNEYDGIKYAGLEDSEGYLWAMEDVDMEVGDSVELVMDSMGTDDLMDDEIVSYTVTH